MTWPLFVDFEKYLPRVVGLMTRCADFDKLVDLLEKLKALLADASRLDCKKVIAGLGTEHDETIVDKWKGSIVDLVKLAILSNIKGSKCPPPGYVEKYNEFISNLEVTDFFGKNFQSTMRDLKISPGLFWYMMCRMRD